MGPYCNKEKILYQSTIYTKLYIDTFGKATALVVENNGCPSFALCDMKDIPIRSAFIIKYCPECGRKLNE